MSEIRTRYPFEGEVRLLRWGESSAAGRTITLELPPDAGDSHPFKGFPVGHSHGARFRMRFDVIRDDETVPTAQEEAPARHPDPDRSERARTTYRNLPPDKRAAADAGRYCTDPRFARFALERKGMAAVSGDPVTHTANWLRRHLGVESRGDIAVNPEARRKWEALRYEFEQWAGLLPEIRG